MRAAASLAIVLVTLLTASEARAELAAGVLAGTNTLTVVDTAAPGATPQLVPVTGLGSGQRLVALDYRWFPSAPGVPGLYGLAIAPGVTATSFLYRIDPGSGVATAVGTGFAVEPGSRWGMDFNPTSDRVRVVNDEGENYRLNPATGARADNTDDNLNPGTPVVDAVAYDRIDADPATPTTLFGVNQSGNQLVTIGTADGTPESANTGTVHAIGPLGALSPLGSPRNLDITPDGTAYVSQEQSGSLQPTLYTANLATGALTKVGDLPVALEGLAIIPPASVQFATASSAVAEGATATITVTRSGDVQRTARVGFTAVAGTASGADFFASTPGTLTFFPGETSQDIPLPTAADADDEPDETLAVVLSGPDGATTLGAPGQHVLTITDDDAPAATPTPADTTPPSLTRLRVPRSIAQAKLLARGVRIKVATDEPSRLVVDLRGTVQRATVAANNLILQSKRRGLGSGTRTIKLKPKRELFGRPRKTVRLQVRVVATDRAGNRRAASATLTVRT